MPLYSFRCGDCDHRFDELVPYQERSAVRCPLCGGPAQPVLAGFAVQAGAAPGGGALRPSAAPRFT